MFDSELFISLTKLFIVLWVYITEKFNSLNISVQYLPSWTVHGPSTNKWTKLSEMTGNDRWRKIRNYLELISFVKSGCLNFRFELVLLLRTLSRNKIYILKIILREKLPGIIYLGPSSKDRGPNSPNRTENLFYWVL